MDPVIVVAALVAGYLIGSISSARIVARRVAPDVDITRIVTQVGDGIEFVSDSVSATALRMKVGRKYGLLVLSLDMLKAIVPVLAFRLAFPGQPYYVLAAAAVLVGHNWPAFYRFKGGRGESVILGSLLVFDPLGLVLMLSLGMLVGFLVGNILVLRWGGFVLMVPWFLLVAGSVPMALWMVFADAAFAIAMIPELRQYFAMRKLAHDPSNEDIAKEYGMGASLGRALDRYSIPGLIGRFRSPAG
jgi:glycerol-3-phosphate acyltransferase PlsY